MVSYSMMADIFAPHNNPKPRHRYCQDCRTGLAPDDAEAQRTAQCKVCRDVAIIRYTYQLHRANPDYYAHVAGRAWADEVDELPF